MSDNVNTMYPYEAGYQRTVHPDDRIDPGSVTARAATTSGTVVERSFAAVMHARDAFAKHVDATAKDQHLYSTQGYNEQIAAFQDTAAARAAETAVADVRSRRDQAQTAANSLRGALIQRGDAAQESRNSRFCDRTLRTLDSAKDFGALTSLTDELLAGASRTELGVLLEELGPYVKTRIEGMNINDVRAKDKILGGYTTSIENAVRRVAPEYDKAQATLRKAEQALSLVEAAGSMLRRGFADGRPPSPEVLAKLNPSLSGRLPTDLRGTLPVDNGGRYDPDK